LDLAVGGSPGEERYVSGRKKRREIQSGRERQDSVAWARLYREVHPGIRSWFAARVASEQDAEDLAEEVFTRLTRGDKPQDLKAYIAIIMANALSGYQRRRARNRDFLQRLLADATRADETRRHQPDELPEDGESSEKRIEVEKVLSTLPPGQAELLRWRFVEGLRMAEVARRVGCSRNAAYKRLHRTIRRLRERYATEPPEPAKEDRKNGKNTQDS
jgi:RNA polymerase sigma-70 factor, ECF subfamily